FVPNSEGAVTQTFEDRVYSGQFSEDGTLFYACTQDFVVHLFDASDPLNFRPSMHFLALEPIGRWTITDVALSHDKRNIIYSSITPYVHLARVHDNDDDQVLLDFSSQIDDQFGIWSLRFSGDGREIVAGTSDATIRGKYQPPAAAILYDIETQRLILRQTGHKDEVNAVCYADAHASHILYSGSDDTLINVWDRRVMCSSKSDPVGVFPGHLEGITFVSSKGDGRYCLSNGKDQAMKLWDIRMMMSFSKLCELPRVDFRSDWDYSFMEYPMRTAISHPNDCSVQTYKGHRVLRTLIRCYFSPAFSTEQRYVYSGSEDGRIHVYNLDGSVRQILNVRPALGLPPSIPARSRRHQYLDDGRGYAVVRDVSWHPHLPVIASTTWRGRNGTNGSIVVHTYA
ncbi:WD40-repeat-containing domain protein, partial [Thamnocephalis sphaerospora]